MVSPEKLLNLALTIAWLIAIAGLVFEVRNVDWNGQPYEIRLPAEAP